MAYLFPAGFGVVYDPNSTAFESCKGRKKGSFANQASIQVRVKGGSSVSVNLFKNGRVKLAGCKSLVQCRKVANVVVKALRAAKGDTPVGYLTAVADPSSLHIVDGSLRIVMTKAEGELSRLLDLTQAKAALADKGFTVRYEPARYCGLVVNVPNPTAGANDLSVMIFASGKAFVTGNGSETDVTDAFVHVRDSLVSALDAPVSGRKRKSKPTDSSGPSKAARGVCA